MIRRQPLTDGAQHRGQLDEGQLVNFAIPHSSLQDKISSPVRAPRVDENKFIKRQELVSHDGVKRAFAQAFYRHTGGDNDTKLITGGFAQSDILGRESNNGLAVFGRNI
ncbi:hypothetical protein BC89_30355 [Pseudomonas monteilii]|nr:hypothetical protein BC89_30355 [Pseudomonas monteilii]